MRTFVAGMGGASHYGFGTIQPNSQARNSDTYGVLKFTLHANSYDWQFVPVGGQDLHRQRHRHLPLILLAGRRLLTAGPAGALTDTSRAVGPRGWRAPQSSTSRSPARWPMIAAGDESIARACPATRSQNDVPPYPGRRDADPL